MSNSTLTVDDIRDLLIKAICSEMGVAPAELATDRRFTEYGVDSLAALAVAMEVEDTCGLSGLPTTLLWDYPTVDALAPALWDIAHGRQPAPPVDASVEAIADGR